MATLTASPGIPVPLLAANQSGASFNSDVIDRSGMSGPATVQIGSTAGTTIKADIQGSEDGTNWFNVEYALIATPTTKVVTQITITTTVIVTYLVSGGYGYRFLRVAFSANTGMTINAADTLAVIH
jgi:hypothetical protein